MKASELRIGNYLYETGDIAVVGLDTFKHWKQLNLHLIVKPIPLTEEWLLRFGIKTWFLDRRFSIVLNEDGSFSVYAHANGRSVFITHISFVHTLQNFYYALTGEELTINEGK